MLQVPKPVLCKPINKLVDSRILHPIQNSPSSNCLAHLGWKGGGNRELRLLWLNEMNELQYCPCCQRPITLLGASKLISPCEALPLITAPQCADSSENRDCTIRCCLLVAFFTFDVIVVNWSGCVGWGCQTWTRGGGERSPRAWHSSSRRVRVLIHHAELFPRGTRRYIYWRLAYSAQYGGTTPSRRQVCHVGHY